MTITYRNRYTETAECHAYTVADGIRDGVMRPIDTDLRTEAGYKIPVVLTTAAYDDAITWHRGDHVAQSETGRAWDVLSVIRAAARAATTDPGRRLATYVWRVPNRTRSGNLSKADRATKARLVVTVQALNTNNDPCIVVSLPGED